MKYRDVHVYFNTDDYIKKSVKEIEAMKFLNSYVSTYGAAQEYIKDLMKDGYYCRKNSMIRYIPPHQIKYIEIGEEYES